MRKEIEYKLQGDGRDSWMIKEYDENDNLITSYMVYENPNKLVDISNIDIDTLNEEQLNKLIIKIKEKL